MIPVSLKLSNFTSYGENVPELDFTKFKLAAISGPNGAGKSSLLDAITWCLWGWSRAGDGADELVHLGAKEMWVEFCFELDGHEFKVIRQRSLGRGGSTNLEFWSSKNNLTEGTIKATQQKIIDTLHLSFETFTNSSFLRQGHADEFTTKGPSDRKRILADILGLSHYDDLEQKAREKTKDVQNKLKLLEYQLLEIEAELSQKEEREKTLQASKQKVSELETNIKNLEQEVKLLQNQKEILQNLQQQQTELQEIIRQGKERSERIKNLELRIKNFENTEQKIEKLQKDKTELEDLRKKQQEKLQLEKELANLQGELKLKNQQKQTLQKQMEELQEELKKLALPGAKCPTCGQEIGKTEKHRVIYDLRIKNEELGKKIEEIKTEKEETEIKKLEKKLSDLIVDNNKLISLENSLKELESLQKQKEQILQDQASLETEKKTREELLTLYKNKDLQIKKLQGELAKLPQVRGDLTAKEKELEQLKSEERTARGLLGQATELISRAEQMEKLQKQKQEEKQIFEKQKNIFEELSLAFGKKGIQAMIIETAIPEIEDEANRLLDKLTDGRMKVSFLTQREGKTTDSLIETLDIVISDEMGQRPYEMYSLDGNDLVYIRKNGQIRSIPIQQLWSTKAAVEKQGEYQLQNTDAEALCYVNGKAKWQRVDKILRHKSPAKLLEVKCGPGNYTVRLTKNHSIYVLTPNGIKVRRTDELKPNDYLLSPRLIPQEDTYRKIDLTNFITADFVKNRELNHKPLKWDKNSIWSRSDHRISRYIPPDADWGKLIGIAVAEGSGQTGYSIAAGSNLGLTREVVQFASKYFGTPKRSLVFVSQESMKRYVQNAPGISSDNPKAQYRPYIGGRLIAHIIKNMVGDKASMKRIPDFIFSAPKETQIAFIQGLVLGDGHLSNNPEQSKSQVAITTVSRRLTGELIFLCRQLGIWARVEKHGDEGFRRGMNHQRSYRIVISGKKNLEILGIGSIVSNYDTAVKYEGIPYSLVGVSRINGKRFQRHAEDQIFDCGIRRVPKSVREAYRKIQDLVEEWNILEVREIKEIDPTSEYVYDLMVPNNNSFVAGNGPILVHNSGGEAFRVNFAIRLAISKLLTRRAGARLQFLVIDEGFGTQDAQGRTRIVEVLDQIKNDFEKILVITHLEELKEEFPVRIEVSKDSSGSTFEVVGA